MRIVVMEPHSLANRVWELPVPDQLLASPRVRHPEAATFLIEEIGNGRGSQRIRVVRTDQFEDERAHIMEQTGNECFIRFDLAACTREHASCSSHVDRVLPDPAKIQTVIDLLDG